LLTLNADPKYPGNNAANPVKRSTSQDRPAFQALIYSQSFFPFSLNLRIIVFLPQRGMAHIVSLPAP
jgi:hypothetical protein